MAKIHPLFDLSNFERRKTAQQSEFDELHKDDLLKFKDIIIEAFDKTIQISSQVPQHCKDKNCNAVIMSGFIRGLLLENFPLQTKEDGSGRIMFTREGKFCIYFKKLNDGKKPSNVRTDHAEMIEFQRTMAGGEKMPIVFVGYIVDDSWAELAGIYAVYINGRKIEWTTVIDENPSSSSNQLQEITPVAPTQIAPRETRIRRKTS